MLYEVPAKVMKDAFELFEQIAGLPTQQQLLEISEQAPDLDTSLAVLVLVAADVRAARNQFLA